MYVRSKSCSQFDPSLDFSQRPVIVLPSSLNVPVKRWEKFGESRHSYQTLSRRLISYTRKTPRESK
jgi:hypothetical protein